MKFGFSAPFRGPLANPQDIRTIAEAAERFAYDTITVADHIVVPSNISAVTIPTAKTANSHGLLTGAPTAWNSSPFWHGLAL